MQHFSFETGVSLERARALLAPFAIQETEILHPTEAFGRRLLKDVVSNVNHPNGSVSALDGVAVDQHAKVGDVLNIVGESRAGAPFLGKIETGECVQVYTGAVLPQNAAAVVGVEHLQEENGGLRLQGQPQQNAIRANGEDFEKGENILQAGQWLNGSAVALAVAAGVEKLCVARPMRVGIVSSGDELVPLGQPLGLGDVHDSNRWGLQERLRRCGAEAIWLGHLADAAGAPEAIARTAKEAGCDLVISSGGVSMGKHDGLRDSMINAGEIVFWKIRMRPGGPVMLGHIEGVPFLGLPGNPVSSLVAFDLLAAPALFGLQMVEIVGVAEETLRGAPDRDVYLRVHSGPNGVRPFDRQSSGVLRSLHEAPVLAHVPAGEKITSGRAVRLLVNLT